jgi:hypothetical protein
MAEAKFGIMSLRDLCASVVILSLSKDYHRETEGTREARSRPIDLKAFVHFSVSLRELYASVVVTTEKRRAREKHGASD